MSASVMFWKLRVFGPRARRWLASRPDTTSWWRPPGPGSTLSAVTSPRVTVTISWSDENARSIFVPRLKVPRSNRSKCGSSNRRVKASGRWMDSSTRTSASRTYRPSSRSWPSTVTAAASSRLSGTAHRPEVGHHQRRARREVEGVDDAVRLREEPPPRRVPVPRGRDPVERLADGHLVHDVGVDRSRRGVLGPVCVLVLELLERDLGLGSQRGAIPGEVGEADAEALDDRLERMVVPPVEPAVRGPGAVRLAVRVGEVLVDLHEVEESARVLRDRLPRPRGVEGEFHRDRARLSLGERQLRRVPAGCRHLRPLVRLGDRELGGVEQARDVLPSLRFDEGLDRSGSRGGALVASARLGGRLLLRRGLAGLLPAAVGTAAAGTGRARGGLRHRPVDGRLLDGLGGLGRSLL